MTSTDSAADTGLPSANHARNARLAALYGGLEEQLQKIATLCSVARTVIDAKTDFLEQRFPGACEHTEQIVFIAHRVEETVQAFFRQWCDSIENPQTTESAR